MFPTIHGVVSQSETSGSGGGGGGDAFPQVEGVTTNDGDNTPATEHSITLPSNISAGDLLLVFVRVHDFNEPGGMSGWTRLDSRLSFNASAIYYRVASGGETAVTITTANSSRIAYVAYRISGANGVEGEFADSDTLQPPEVTPTWGAAKTLWFTAVTDRQSNYTFTAPTNYANQADGGNPSSSFTSRHRVSAAYRELEAASEQPGVWGKSTAPNAPHAATVAVRPA